MLIEFRVENFRSFKSEQVLSMVASGSDKSLPDNCMDAGKLKLVRGAAVYGANASGKSNLVKALDVMQNWIRNSTSMDKEKRHKITPFLLEESCSQEPTSFEATFIHEKIRYQYGFSALGNLILKEWLFAFPKGSPQMWFKRTFDNEKERSIFKFGSYFKGVKTKLEESTRNDTLLLSLAAEWNHEQLTPVYEWFRQYLKILGPRYQLEITENALHTAQEIGPERDLHKYVERFLKDADLGVCGLTVEEISADEIGFPEEISSEGRQVILPEMRSKKKLRVGLLHKSIDEDQSVELPLSEESDGTKRMFELSIPWLQSLANGFTVVVDELEDSLHSLLTRELVKPFFDPFFSKSGAQLIFTTHDTTLLDPELLRRDQIWFTEKDTEGSTELYSLADYKEHRARKGESLNRGYLSGRYGAVPILKAFSIHDTEG